MVRGWRLRQVRRLSGFALLALTLAATSSCALVSSIRGAPPLFAGGPSVQQFDFEEGALHAPPEGFEARLGHWAIADSPTAASGNQVLVRDGDGAAMLVVKDAEGVSAAAGEVSVRVFLGASGAGISCDAGQKVGYSLKLEPEAARIALYRRTADVTTLVDHVSTSVPKGEWARIGIRCDSDRVVGYLDGKPVVKARGSIAEFDLALYADPGVAVQFDDLKFWASR